MHQGVLVHDYCNERMDSWLLPESAERSRNAYAGRLEFIPPTKGGIDVGRGKIIAGQSALHAAVHGAKVDIEVLVEPVVEVEGNRLEAPAANAMRCCRAARLRSGAVGTL